MSAFGEVSRSNHQSKECRELNLRLGTIDHIIELSGHNLMWKISSTDNYSTMLDEAIFALKAKVRVSSFDELLPS